MALATEALAIFLKGSGDVGLVYYRSEQPGAGYLFIALLGFFVALFLYQAYRRKKTAAEGPPDPSAYWRAGTEPRGGRGVTSFGYSRGTLVFLRYFTLLPLLFGPAIYLLSSPRPTGVDLLGLAGFEIFVVLAFYMGYRACVAYSIKVTPDSILINGLFRQREFLFSSLGKVALLEGGGRGPRYVLALYDQKEKQLCALSNGVERFEEMVALIKEAAFAAGTPYRYRDMWGCWTT